MIIKCQKCGISRNDETAKHCPICLVPEKIEEMSEINYKKNVKTNCVAFQCLNKLPGTLTYYLDHGNFCLPCDRESTLKAKAKEIKEFINQIHQAFNLTQ